MCNVKNCGVDGQVPCLDDEGDDVCDVGMNLIAATGLCTNDGCGSAGEIGCGDLETECDAGLTINFERCNVIDCGLPDAAPCLDSAKNKVCEDVADLNDDGTKCLNDDCGGKGESLCPDVPVCDPGLSEQFEVCNVDGCGVMDAPACVDADNEPACGAKVVLNDDKTMCVDDLCGTPGEEACPDGTLLKELGNFTEFSGP